MRCLSIMRCCTSLVGWWRHQLLLLCLTSVAKSTIIIEHLLTASEDFGSFGFLENKPLKNLNICVGYSWQSQKRSWNIYSRLVSRSVVVQHAVARYAVTHYYAVAVFWVPSVRRVTVFYISDTKSTMIMEHLLTPGLETVIFSTKRVCVGCQWQSQKWSWKPTSPCSIGVGVGCRGTTSEAICCIGYQWQSQKWSLNIYLRLLCALDSIYSVLDISDKVKNDH